MNTWENDKLKSELKETKGKLGDSVNKSVRLEETKNGNNLVIGPASPGDEAEYTCQISSWKPSEIVHSVKIRGELRTCN